MSWKLNVTNDLNDGKIFHITFVKKDGTIRSFNARLGVRSHLRGGQLTYDPSANGNIIVFSMDNAGYRTIKVDSILRVKTKGKVYTSEKFYQLTSGILQ